jgi:ADP-ribosylglycohydrolase
MWGAIIGDVVGSVYETHSIKTKDFVLFSERSRFTDDTVLTIAIADCILNKKDYAHTLREYARKYPKKKYGASFIQWFRQDDAPPYNSYGNGSAMRVSPVGIFFQDLNIVLQESKKSAEVTHNHKEGIKGAQAVASAVFLAKIGNTKEEIKNYVVNAFAYDLDRKIDDIRLNYDFDVTCQGSVPESIIAFLESTSFEDAIRNAISLGGDSDTMACIAGGIAEAFYKEIPSYFIEETQKRLNEEFLNILTVFNKSQNEKFL